jgi:hypothetical protein
VGIQTGELSLNMNAASPILRVKFALLAEGGETAGYFEKGAAWSDRSQELLQQLTESLELDALPYVFDEPIEEGDPTQEVEEPPQI